MGYCTATLLLQGETGSLRRNQQRPFGCFALGLNTLPAFHESVHVKDWVQRLQKSKEAPFLWLLTRTPVKITGEMLT